LPQVAFPGGACARAGVGYRAEGTNSTKGNIMAEFVITPQSTADLDVGGFFDDSGRRFVGLSFAMPGGDAAIVTFTPDLFQAYAAHLAKAAKNMAGEDFWATVPRQKPGK